MRLKFFKTSKSERINTGNVKYQFTHRTISSRNSCVRDAVSFFSPCSALTWCLCYLRPVLHQLRLQAIYQRPSGFRGSRLSLGLVEARRCGPASQTTPIESQRGRHPAPRCCLCPQRRLPIRSVRVHSGTDGGKSEATTTGEGLRVVSKNWF